MASDGKVVIKIDSNAEQVAVEFNQLDKSINKTERDAKRLDGQTRKTSKAFGGLKTALSSVAVAFAAVKIKEFTNSLVNAASEAEETANKFNVTFSGIAEQANESSRAIASAYGLANDETQKLLSNTGDLLTGFGFSQQAALDLAEETNKLAVDLASFTNVEGGATRASEALTKALLGERESVKTLGIAILEEDVKAKVKALEISGKLTTQSEREKKAIATLAIAYEQSKNAIGDFARSQESYANQSRITASRIRDLQVALGNELLPVFTELRTSFNEFITQQSPQIITAFKSIKIFVEGIAQSLGNTSGEFRVFADIAVFAAKSVAIGFDLAVAAITDGIRAIGAFGKAIENLAKGQFDKLNEGFVEFAEEGSNLEAAIQRVANGYKDIEQSANSTTAAVKSLNQAVSESTNGNVIDLEKVKAITNPPVADTTSKWDAIGQSIQNSLESAFVASFERGQSLLQNLGNAFKALFTQLAARALALGLLNLFTGGTGGFIAGAAGAFTKNAKGNAFNNGSVTAFAKGGVVDSPQTFPMANGTGLMGEAGAEAILPLKRTSTGDLGVQATPSNVNVYNQSSSQIEVVQRPDNETDIFVRRVNAALSSERTDGSFGSALSRQQSSGVQAS